MFCDECGKEKSKAFRIYNGHHYCGTCYARIYKYRLCPKCGNYARLNKHDPQAVCIKCEKAKPCVRCGKTEYKIGKITSYGPVCNSCVRYFQDIKLCGLCGNESRHLSRSNEIESDIQVCPKCARKNHRTCPSCRRSRILLEASEGNFLCKACLEGGEVACQKCGKMMPAGRGNVCESCYWDEAFRKRLKIDYTAFSSPSMGKCFLEFGEWLMDETRSKKAALTIHKYLPFFLEIEKKWKIIPCYKDLLEYFGADGLRRVRQPMRWLKEMYGIIPDVKMREHDSEIRSIKSILSSFKKGTLACNTISRYYDILEDRLNNGKTSIRSVRLALKPASSLFLYTDVTGDKIPDQNSLNAYMQMVPGQKAAITGFLNFLNKEYELNLAIQNDDVKNKEKRRNFLEKKLLNMMKEPDSKDKIKLEWIITALEYFHGITDKKSIKTENIQITTDGYIISLINNDFFLPRKI